MINDDGVDTQLPEEGSGLYSNIKDRLSSFYHGIRLDWPPKDRSMLKQYGAFSITHITLGRAPIHDMIDKAMQVLSLGRWDDLKKQYNYDRMYHLFMLVQLSNGSLLRVEKNAVVSISNNYRIESDAEFFPVQMHEGGIVLSTFFNKTIEAVGLRQFFVYSAFSENCQRFLLDLLNSNKLLTEESQHFIYQDISELSKKLPSITKSISQSLTDTAHRADILLNGMAFP